MAELSPILAELEKLYTKLGGWKGLDVSNPPIITLSSKGRKQTQTGWYNPGKWVDSQEDTLAALAGVESADRVQLTRGEIVLATELLSDPVQTAAELYKQAIVHQWSESHQGNLEGIVGAQGYYPIAWKRLGLTHEFKAYVIPEQPSRGWAGWAPNPRNPGAWERWVRENMNLGVFEVARNSDAPLKRPGSRMKKWTCDCTTIRSATRVTATCTACSSVFFWAEAELPPRNTYRVRPDQVDALAARGF